MEASRRDVLIGTSSTGLLALARPALAAGDVLTPEAFGAKGDGRTNDTEAFAALAGAINARGGGTIALRPVTYIVGRQAGRLYRALRGRIARFAFAPSDILTIVNCAAPIIIRGNGATLRAASGLRFGTFDPETGRPFEHAMPFLNREFTASPYVAMISVESCSGLIDISDVELDGNLPRLEIGGKFGDNGWQIPASGILLRDNSGPERLSGVYSHHHGLDGLTLYSLPNRTASTTVADVRCEHNGRQGCSLVGGHNYAFDRCRFAHTGKAGLHSGPGAGVDIEAGWHPVRNVNFSACEFSDNSGCGVIADSGDSADVSFYDCRFIGTTSWAAWPKKPRFRFDRCLIAGSVVHPYGDADASQACAFVNCDFRDDPALSPNAAIYFGGNARHPVVNAPVAPNVLFDHCRFRLNYDGGLPFTSDVIYSDCEMSQRFGVLSHPGGLYVGSNRISGNVDVSGLRIRGEVLLNGRVISQADTQLRHH